MELKFTYNQQVAPRTNCDTSVVSMMLMCIFYKKQLHQCNIPFKVQQNLRRLKIFFKSEEILGV